MAKLPAVRAQAASEAEAQSFAALPAGIYTMRLAKVTPTQTKTGANAGSPMWQLEFDDVHNLEGKKMPGRQFSNLVLIESVDWKVKQFFDAFEAPTDTDTDDLLGRRIRGALSVRTIPTGARAGQEGNQLETFIPLQEGDPGYKPSKGAGAGVSKVTASVGAGPASAGEEF